jgi:demethylmenaquinone methyltransferase/2-methoxy-6-polyprenyl-1,4-benzoquinol methylase
MQALLSHRMSLRDSVATADGKSRYVRRLFATIADRYDLITVLLSYGRDRSWKRRLVRMARVTPGTRVLDLATGTGDIAFLLARDGARVTALDITARMIELAARKKSGGAAPSFLVGDMSALPFRAACFDIVTTGYGLRNVPDLPLVLDEIARVLVPGGQLLSLDFNRPANPVIRAVYLTYLSLVGSALGWALHRDPDTYRYIPESIRLYPGAGPVAALMRAHGFARAVHHRVLGGLMAIHHART